MGLKFRTFWKKEEYASLIISQIMHPKEMFT